MLFFASDHAGFTLKNFLIKTIQEWQEGKNWKAHSPFLNEDLEDLGVYTDEACDYPDATRLLCKKMLDAPIGARGILACGTGVGMCIAANRYSHIHAAVCSTASSTATAREKNNINVLCLGANLLDKHTATSILHAFITTSFSGGRHERRIAKIGLSLD